ncbi:MAG TPA: alpha/beta hydrolase [Candidatus Binatus sp.]|uniref:alpha/beta fold hydrolase n=1 Tax=Candidatus Binatus sp. TaxID=2811406 RepID=UPI002F3FA2B1
MEPEIKYAKNGDVHIAYRILGDGPGDLVLVPGTISHAELLWELPTYKYLLQRLTSFARVIVFDKRGQGLSDRVAAQTLEERTADVGAVMDAAGSRNAIVYGWSEGGLLSLTFAATRPERTSALVLYGTFVSMKAEPWALTESQFDGFLATLEKHWGTGVLLRLNAPSRLKDKAFMQWFGRIERESSSPSSILALMRADYQIDVRHLLPSIRVPTMILHRADDALIPVASGRYIAEKIPGAVYHELPGMDHLVLDHETQDRIADLIEEFVARLPESSSAAVRNGPSTKAFARGFGIGKPAPNGTKPANMFRSEGEYWTVSYEGRVLRFKGSKGLPYIAHLLAHPNSEFRATTLAGGSRPGESVDRGDAGEVLDGQAKAAYRLRIKELQEELKETKRTGDEKRGLKVEHELEALSAELARAVGLRGRDRRAASSAERARVNVTRTIRIAIGRIKEHHSGLANYLDKTIRTGTFCSYQPDPIRHIFWNL